MLDISMTCSVEIFRDCDPGGSRNSPNSYVALVKLKN